MIGQAVDAALAGLKPIPAWAARSLDGQYRTLEEAQRNRNLLGVRNAERAIARLRRRVGLDP